MHQIDMATTVYIYKADITITLIFITFRLTLTLSPINNAYSIIIIMFNFTPRTCTSSELVHIAGSCFHIILELCN